MQLVYNEQKRRYEFLYTKAEMGTGYPLVTGANFQFDGQAAPKVWYTASARRALKLSPYADDALRERILRDAGAEPDPDACRIEYHEHLRAPRAKGRAGFTWHAPYPLNPFVKGRGWQYADSPDKHWWTTQADHVRATTRAVADFNDAVTDPRARVKLHISEAARAEVEAQSALKVASIAASRATDADVELPCPEGLEYMPFQKAGISFCLGRPSVLLGDDMGLGKTVMAVGAVNADRDTRQVLIVVPASLKVNWRRELEKWSVRTPNILMLSGSPTSGREDLIRTLFDVTRRKGAEVDVCIINFDILHKWEAALVAHGWDLFIVDEAHKAKGGKRTKRGAACLKLARVARRKLLLTGTPIPNRVAELLPLLEMLGAVDQFGGGWGFLNRYCGAHNNGFGWQFDGAANLDELNDKLRSTCFVAGTEIYSEHGQIPIQELVSRQLPVRVWSRDQLGRLALKPVVGFSRTSYQGLLVKIRFAAGEFVCTPDHRIFTDKGEVRAGEIVTGDSLYLLPEATRKGVAALGFAQAEVRQRDPLFKLMRGKVSPAPAEEGAYPRQVRTPEDANKNLRGLREVLRGQESEGVQVAPLLHLFMSGQVGLPDLVKGQAQRAGSYSGASSQETHREAGQAEKAAWLEGDSAPTPAQEHQRQSHTPPVCRTCDAGRGAISPVGAFGRAPDCQREDNLCRYSSDREPDYRSGRRGSREATEPAQRQTTGRRLSRSRVLSVEVLGVGDRGDFAGSAESDFCVYDIQVADNHNYFANGALVHNCMIRRLKTEVLKELPRKRRQVIELPAVTTQQKSLIERERTAEQRKAELRQELRARVELAKASEDPDEHRRAVGALRDGMKTAFDEMSKLRHETALAKLPQAIEHVEDMLEECGKVVVGAHHRDVVEMLVEHFNRQREATYGEGAAVMLYGGMSQDEKQASVDRFQTDPSCRLFVGSIQAAGVGLTLTAASTVILVELDWVPANVSQFEDRVLRIGQEADSVLVQHLVLEGSLDARMARTLIQKQEIADKALDRETGATGATAELPEDFEGDEALVLPERREAGYAPEEIVRVRYEPSAYEERAATHGVTQAEIGLEALKMTPEKIKLVHRAVRELAGWCDGAVTRDGVGFNGTDAKIGHNLAARPTLSPKAAALAKHVVFKYKDSQLGGRYEELFT